MDEEGEISDDPTTYDHRRKSIWMDGLMKMDLMNIKHLLVAFAYFGIPESFLDVGCGTGILVKTAEKLGVRSYGIDQLVDPDWGPNFTHINLVDYWVAPAPVDMVWCIEVAEHLHESGHGTLMKTLCDNLKEGPNHHIIFSSARPGQGGYGHVSNRPAEYWHNEAIAHKLGFNREATMNLALLFSNCGSSLNYFWDNLIVFSR